MDKHPHKKHNFIIQGGILGIAGILTRIIGMFYRIPVTNIIGPRGNGYYAAAYQIYVIMLLISSYSLPLAVSKLVSARVGAGEYKNARKLFDGAIAFSFVTGSLVCIAVFFGADYFSSHLMSEPLSGIALRFFAPTLLIVALMGVIRGYFQGMGTMVPTAVSQILEQIINAVVSILGAKYLMDYGTRVAALLRNESLGPAWGAAGNSLGTGVGALAGFIFLIFMLLMFRRSFYMKAKKEDINSGRSEGYSDILKILILTIIPVIMSTAIYNVGELLSNSVFNRMMAQRGFNETKSYLWGVYSGEYKILLNVPIALSNAMCSSVVPALTTLIAARDPKGARRRISQVMRFMLILSLPCAAGLFTLANPIMSMLFRDGHELAASLMHLGAVNIVLYSISTLTNGILQGINKMHIPVRNSFIALVIQLSCLICLLRFTDFGIFAVVIANFIFALTMCILNQRSIRKYIKYRQEVRRTFFAPAICSALMGAGIHLFYRLFIPVMSNTLTVITSILFGAFVYSLLVLRLNVITQAEIASLPKGKYILAVLRRLQIVGRVR